jgi:signal peptidase I
MTVKRVVKDVVLGAAALAGLLCVLWLVASTVFGLQMLLFNTGSMAPTMPTGTAAIGQPVTADQIAVGDVVMVERPGKLPVTHRVVSVETDPAVEGGVILVLKGDDNEVNDPSPYHVTEAVRVVFPIPGLGTVIQGARTPLFLGLTTLFVAGLVLWAFWPASKPKHTAQAQDAAADDHEDDPHEDTHDDRPRVLADAFSGEHHTGVNQ